MISSAYFPDGNEIMQLFTNSYHDHRNDDACAYSIWHGFRSGASSDHVSFSRMLQSHSFSMRTTTQPTLRFVSATTAIIALPFMNITPLSQKQSRVFKLWYKKVISKCALISFATDMMTVFRYSSMPCLANPKAPKVSLVSDGRCALLKHLLLDCTAPYCMLSSRFL